MEKIKLMFWGDAVAKTGFSRVLHSIADNLPESKYDISWIGVNYHGDPHPYKYRIYPASSKNPGDYYGYGRLKEIINFEQPQIMFILNDAWIQDPVLNKIKEEFQTKKLPKIVTYTPVDAEDHDSDWYKNFDIVNKIVAYTPFGKNVINKARPELDIEIIKHGVDTNIFYKLDYTKEEVKKALFPDNKNFYESFIVLSAARNQPRKRLDLTMKAFSLFAEGKPDNVRLYMHCGVKDASMDIMKLSARFNLDAKLILTNTNSGIQQVPEAKLNHIYNATDVGINTSLGEGWCLPCIEHAVTGAPQVVPDHSALHDLYEDCGLLVPVKQSYTLDSIMTTGKLVSPEDMAEKLDLIYNNKELYNELSKKSIEKFSSPEYSWKEIGKQWDKLFSELV